MIDAPFNIRGYNYTLKPEKRFVPVFGQRIAASSSFGMLTDGSGLNDADDDRLLEHTVGEAGMWVSLPDKPQDSLVFDLTPGHTLGTIAIWNYNKPAYTDLGVQKADISVWTEKGGWKTILKGAEVQEAEGTNDYDEPTILTFDPVSAEKVRFENVTAFNPDMKQVGLSEVVFYEPLGPAACNPEPTGGSQIAYLDAVPFMWTAGKGAIAHDVYIGQSAEDFIFLGRIKSDPKVKVSGLVPGTEYVWRIDEVAENGAVETGPAWSLTLREPLLAHWKLDETEGTSVSDSSGNEHHGSTVGEPGWRSSGMEGGAFLFDGSNYVDTGDLQLSQSADAITIAVWLKVDAFDKNYQAIVTKGDASWRLSREGQSSTLHFACDGVNPPYLIGKTPVDDEQWHHVAAVYDGTTTFLYIDGQLDVSQPVNGRLRQDNQPVRIGDNSQQSDRLWKGMIDDVRIYECALTADQIRRLGRHEAITIPADGEIALVDADLIDPGQSLKEVAAAMEPPVSTGRNNNLIVVGLVVLVVAGLAAVSILRKNK